MDTAEMVVTWTAAGLALIVALVRFIYWRHEPPRVKGAVTFLAACVALFAFTGIFLRHQMAAREAKWRATPPVLDVFLQG